MQSEQDEEINRLVRGDPAGSPAKLFGFVKRRERWSLSWRGWVALLVLLTAVAYVTRVTIFPFLAVTDRVDANILVVEGWVRPYAIAAAVEEFRRSRYQEIFTTGGPVQGSGGYTSDYNTSAHVGEGSLRAAGLPPKAIRAIPSHIIGRDRTYHSALALRDWLQTRGLEVHGVNIVTENVHARRTRLLFMKAFGPKVSVGIIAAPDPDYDPRRWWRYSEGVREVIGESIAYVYARFFFHPVAAEATGKEVGSIRAEGHPMMASACAEGANSPSARKFSIELVP